MIDLRVIPQPYADTITNEPALFSLKIHVMCKYPFEKREGAPVRILNGFAILFLCAATLTKPSTAAELTGTLKKIKSSGTIVIGHREASRPFSFVDYNGIPAGYSIDLCDRIVNAVKDKLGLSSLTTKYVAITAENRIDKIADGSIDIECGSTTNTLSRQEHVDFTNTIFITGASLLSRADSEIKGMSDLSGKSVSVVAGTTTEKNLAAGLKQGLVEATVIKVKDQNEGVSMLTAGKVDAHAADQLVLIGLAKAEAEPAQFSLAPELFSYEPYALMVRRNDADFRLVANRALAQLYRTGDIGTIYEQWFGDWGGRPSSLLLAMYALNGLPE